MRCFENTPEAHTKVLPRVLLATASPQEPPVLFPARDDKPRGQVHPSKDYDPETTLGMRKEVWKIDLWISAIRCVGTFSFRDACTQSAQGPDSSASDSSFALPDRCENSICCNETLMTLTKPSFNTIFYYYSRKLEAVILHVNYAGRTFAKDICQRTSQMAFTNLRQPLYLS